MPVPTITVMRTDRDALLHRLTQDPSGASVGLTQRALPPGRVVEVPGAGPLFWISEGAPTPEDVAWARAGFEESGMWPLLVDGDGTQQLVEHFGDGAQTVTSPWLGVQPATDLPALDPERVLADEWSDLIPDNEADEDCEPDERVSALAPAGPDWPGLVPAADWEGHPDQYADSMTEFILANDWFEQPRMILVPAGSSTDAVIASGCDLSCLPMPDHVAGLVAVLGSWERRFGARVIALRPDTLYASVAAPPTDRLQAAHIACEHFAFAPDNVLQVSDSFPEYVDDLINANLWSFWWD